MRLVAGPMGMRPEVTGRLSRIIEEDVDVAESQEQREETPDVTAAADAVDTPDNDASPAEVFEHLARIRGGISNGVVTLW